MASRGLWPFGLHQDHAGSFGPVSWGTADKNRGASLRILPAWGGWCRCHRHAAWTLESRGGERCPSGHWDRRLHPPQGSVRL